MPETNNEAAETLKEKIRQRNEAFNRLGNKQQRIKIARDALAQIAAGRIIVETGNFLVSTDIYMIENRDGDKELSEVLAGVNSCEACALGSLFFVPSNVQII